jgi:hypothetical protein
MEGRIPEQIRQSKNIFIISVSYDFFVSYDFLSLMISATDRVRPPKMMRWRSEFMRRRVLA